MIPEQIAPRRSLVSPRADLWLVCLPIWLPVIYYLGLLAVPSYDWLLFIVVLFFLGETHFAATWLFVFDASNRKWILSNPYYAFVVPAMIVGLLIVIAVFISIANALMLFLLFNYFHVMRQSIGVLKIYGKFGSRSRAWASLAVYGLSAACIAVALMRFTFDFGVSSDVIQIIAWALLGAVVPATGVVFWHARRDDVPLAFVMAAFTGMVMFLPFCFVDKIHHAFAMGVGMHYLQYLAITIPLYLRKSQRLPKNKKRGLTMNVAGSLPRLLLYLGIYASVMVFFSNSRMIFSADSVQYLYLIPVLFQTLHFYVDMFIWRFSKPHIQEQIGPFMFADARR